MKGQKTGGRKPGSENKITTILRQQITCFLTENWNTVQKDFRSLEPKDRLMFYDKMLSYGLPKPAPELTEEVKEQSVVSIFEMIDARLKEEISKKKAI